VHRLPIVTVALVSAVGAACGGAVDNGSRDAAPGHGVITQPTTETTRTTIYFLTEDGAAPIGVRRTIRTRSPYAREALKALLAGPTPDEKAHGIETAIPPGTRLRSLSYKRHGADGTVNLTGLPSQDTLDVMEKARIITQIARTLIGVSGIERVWLRSDGRAWGLGTMNEGIYAGVYSGPWGYDQLVGFDVGEACPGGETVECDHFDALP
jgi:spore germination protein GerM